MEKNTHSIMESAATAAVAARANYAGAINSQIPDKTPPHTTQTRAPPSPALTAIAKLCINSCTIL
jgi:hypothetical protein